ncbi:MAG: FAD-dependent oxidoreductase [Actinomycetota bacterium]|nr:FAD-dependent oxidoreductase [Actinomycetota bacterium]
MPSRSADRAGIPGAILPGVKVNIIGAGFAGLAAAEALSSGGIEIEVFEARDRIGGRVWSHSLPTGAVIERGAEFILDDYDTTRELAQRLGTPLAPTGMAYGDREPRWGPSVEHAELLRVSNLLTELARSHADDPGMALADLLDATPMSSGARAALEARLSISAAHEAGELAGHLAAHTSSTFSESQSARIAGGNSRLAEALAQRLPSPVRTRHPVEFVEWAGESATVKGEGFSSSADSALVTVPATVLEEIVFEPALPEGKRHANRSVDYGHAAKLSVPLEQEADPSAVMSVPDRFWCWTARGDDGAVQPVVSSFAGSSSALEALGVREGTGSWLGRLTELRPDLAISSEGAVGTNWDGDPWVRAAYSVELAGRPRDQGELCEPAGALFFAGEHTAGAWAGTMEGALRSGRRAAHQITVRRTEDK